MFCKNCGKEMNDKAKFCQFCGESIAEEELKEGDQLQNFRYKKREYDRKAFKQEAKDVLKKDNNFLMMIVVMLIVGFLGGAIAATIIGSLIALLLQASVFWVTKNLLINEKVDLDLLYKPLDDFSYALRIIGAALLIGLIVALGTILFVVPGIILALMYSQTIRILADNKKIGIAEAMTKSKELMDGHKWELLVFHLSFIGHFLLVAITLGLWSLYLVPYQTTASINYYFYLRGLENKPIDQITTF